MHYYAITYTEIYKLSAVSDIEYFVEVFMYSNSAFLLLVPLSEKRGYIIPFTSGLIIMICLTFWSASVLTDIKRT